MKKIINVNNADTTTDVALLIARVGIAALMLTHGIPKLIMLVSGTSIQFPAIMGMSSERDYSRKVALEGKSSNDTLVKEIMSTDLPVVHPESTINQCMQLLTDKNIRYLPVFNNDAIAGIISINDVVKEIILSQEETIYNLKEYLYSNS